jgi:beta-glucanase (GH16 family)
MRRLRPSIAAVVALATCVLGVAVISQPNALARGVGPTDTGPCGGESVVKADGTAWQCTFDDEFGGTALDTDNWVPQLTSNSQYTTGPTGSQACYVSTPANISVVGGYLNLTAKKEAAPFTCTSGATGSFNTQYTSGMVISKSKFSQQYGRFEVRAKLPQSIVKGLQETLWLYPTNAGLYGSTWPESGEIDFAEMYSVKHGSDVPYIHYQADAAATNRTTHTNVVTAACAITFTDFNSYSIVWQPGTLTISVNGKTCLIDNYVATGLTPPAPFDQRFFLALTQALGTSTNGNAFSPTKTKLAATTQIDYVRAWS